MTAKPYDAMLQDVLDAIQMVKTVVDLDRPLFDEIVSLERRLIAVTDRIDAKPVGYDTLDASDQDFCEFRLVRFEIVRFMSRVQKYLPHQ
jgi:hypothetical protein